MENILTWILHVSDGGSKAALTLLLSKKFNGNSENKMLTVVSLEAV